MKLQKLQVENFKCVEDSTEFAVDQVTCLIGKNEAGKTAILEALYKLNPVETEESDFQENDYPRRFITNARETNELSNAKVLTTEWVLEDSDIAIVEKFTGANVLTTSTIKISKGYSNQRLWTISIDDEQWVKNLLATQNFNAAELAQLKNANTIEQLKVKLEKLNELTPKQQKLIEYLQEKFGNEPARKAIYKMLASRIPNFLYFDTYDKLPGKVALTDLKKKKAEQRLNFGDRIFLALLYMTSSNLEDVEQIGTSERLIMELEAIENSLTDQIFEYWSQNKHLDVKFRFDAARPKDPPPFNEGFVFNTRIYNTRHRATVNFDERSTGFIWFFSFLIWFSQVKKNYGQNIFLLLDEPGLSLHPRAQKDLLRYINEKLRPNHQVIYTAHSPFMIDIDHIFSLRTVEDVVLAEQENGRTVEKILGTKVSQKILSRDRDTLVPIQGIIGYDIAQTLFVGPYVVVVEGPTEAAIFNWFSRRLVKTGREGLDIRWAVCPAEGASKVSSFVTLFKGRGLIIAAMMDYHDGQKKMVAKLEESELLEPGHLLKTTDYVQQDEADIEDVIGRVIELFLNN